jgi:hypothetical protein
MAGKTVNKRSKATTGGRKTNKKSKPSPTANDQATEVETIATRNNPGGVTTQQPSLASSAPTTKKSFSIVTGIARQTNAPVSVVEINQPTASVSEQTGDHPSKSWFETLQDNGRMTNDDALVKDLNAYVRNSLFPKLKFIMGKQQMSYSPEGNTICGKICNGVGMTDPKLAVSWWEHYKDMIADILNSKRADVTGAIKRAFQGR